MTSGTVKFKPWLHHYSPIPVFLPQASSLLTRILPSTLFLNPVLFLSPGYYPETTFPTSFMTAPACAEPRPLLLSLDGPLCPGLPWHLWLHPLLSVLGHLGTPVGQPTWVSHCHFVLNITKIHSTIICWEPTKPRSVLIIGQQTI